MFKISRNFSEKSQKFREIKDKLMFSFFSIISAKNRRNFGEISEKNEISPKYRELGVKMQNKNSLGVKMKKIKFIKGPNYK